MGKGSTNDELMDYFNLDPDRIPTQSAFIQRRKQISLLAFQYLFFQFFFFISKDYTLFSGPLSPILRSNLAIEQKKSNTEL
jgi:hypothetical protein